MHDESREVVKFLKFLSKIQKGEKINIYGMFTQSEGIVTSFSRTFINRDNRQNTLNFIEKNINNGISLIDKYIESKNLCEKLMAKNIFEDLVKSKNGIINTKTTYSADTMYCCTIDALIQTLDATIQEFFSKYPDFFER